MNGADSNLLILAFFHFTMGIIILLLSIHIINKKKNLEIIDCFRMMYSFTYGLLPGAVFFLEAKGERNLYYYNYSSEGFVNLYILFFAKILVFFIIQFVYKHLKHDKQEKKVLDSTYSDDKKTYYVGILTLFIGFISIYLWTKAYGSLSNFIANAEAIRSSRGVITNPLAFMQHFASIVLVSFYALLSSFLSRRNKGKRAFIHFIFIILALLGSFIYLMCSGSRVTLAYLAIATSLLLLKYRHKKSIRAYMVFFGAIIIIVLIVIMSLELSVNNLRKNDFIHMIINEFRFTVSSEMIAMDKLSDGSNKIKIIDDVINSLICWIPERLTKFERPMTIWTYNTMNISGTLAYGQSPSDLIATSIYELGIIGIFVFPAIFAIILHFADSILTKREHSAFNITIYVALANRIINMTSHTQLSSFVLGCFSLVLFIGVYKLFKNVRFV